jgi:Family of unknown function (DUF6159)
MGRIRRGIGFTHATWTLIRGRPQLVVLPAVALALQAAVVAVVVGPLWLDVGDHHSRWNLFIDGAVCAYPLTFISTFFNVAYYAQVDAAFRGEPIGAREALGRSAARLRAIALWTLLTTGVGLILRGIEQLPYAGSVAGRIVTRVLDAAWAVASFFVVPALALDDTGVRDSLRRSVTTIRARWGEAATGTVAIGGAGMLLIVPILVAGGIGYVTRDTHPVAGYGLLTAAVLAAGVVLVVQETVSEAFRVAVFRYAAGEAPAGPFAESDLAGAFKPKR